MYKRAQHLSPAIKLAASYTAIIMAISLLFTISLYRVSESQLEDSLRRQFDRFHFSINGQLVRPPNQTEIQADLLGAKNRLKLELLYFNVVILVLGSGASYWLAGRTLRPIENAFEAQRRFTGDASHELRTPLTAMQTEIEVALRDKNLTKDEAKLLLASNLEEVAKLRTLSEGLLRLANLDGKDFPRLPISLQLAAAEAVARIAAQLKSKHISVTNASEDIIVLADHVSLVELIVTLLDNAVKYSPEHTSVTISSKKGSRSGALYIADQGIGIAPSDLPHIFDRFYRADSSRTKSSSDGYGLGLSIAKQIIELHDGTIDVRSIEGKGTTFKISLPLASKSH